MVIEEAIEIAVPFLTWFTLGVVSFLASILNSDACIFIVNDVMQVSPILIMTTLLRWSDAAG
jgi:hypothetical protein